MGKSKFQENHGKYLGSVENRNASINERASFVFLETGGSLPGTSED